MRIVIAGGDIAGLFAALTARRYSPAAQITLIVKEERPVNNLTLLSVAGRKVLSGPGLEPEALKKGRIRILLKHEVTGIDRKGKRLHVWDLEKGREFNEPFDSLILAPAGRRMETPGGITDLRNLFHLTNQGEVSEIPRMVKRKRPETALIYEPVSTGFEIMDHLIENKIRVYVAHSRSITFPQVDEEVSRNMRFYMEERGVRFHEKAELVQLKGEGRVRWALFPGFSLASELVVVEGDILPSIELARKAGVMIGSTGAIHVNERMQTSIESIFAAGESVEDIHFITGKRFYHPLPSASIRQGRVAGINATGARASYPGSLMAEAMRSGRYILARIGLSERSAKEEGFDTRSSVISMEGGAGPDYFKLKLVWEAGKNRVLGASLFSPPLLLRWLERISAAIYGKLKIGDLPSIDTFTLRGLDPFPDPLETEEFPL